MKETIRTHVDRLYEESREVAEYLRGEEVSLWLTADESFKKGLLVAAASYFEKRVKEILIDYVRESTDDNERLVELFQDKVTSRGYQGLFKWTDPREQGARQFWGSFGDSFKTAMVAKIKSDTKLEEGVKAFLELGNDRNRLVHNDFGAFYLEKTSEEIYSSYRQGLFFVERLPDFLRETQ